MRKQEIKLIKEDLKKLIDAEIEWSENNTSGISHDYDCGYIAGLKQIRNNFVDKWAETLSKIETINVNSYREGHGGLLSYNSLENQYKRKKKEIKPGIFDWIWK